ncbi:DNA-binding response regulator [bacterium]|nr:DNA-binding response regulator [bacterium]
MTARICFVEDDPTIQELVGEKLVQKGYQVAAFSEAEKVGTNFSDYDLFVLDVMLAGELSGLELCEGIRKFNPEVPILVLSALSEPQDRIEGLRLGADDYLSKPFEMEELLLRVGGMLKRRQWYATRPPKGNVFKWDAGEVDFSSRVVRTSNEKIQLTQKESMILKLLVEREGETVSRDEILEKVWGYHLFPTNRTVDNFMVRLRKIFETNPSEPVYFHSVRGEGYRFTSSKGEV